MPTQHLWIGPAHTHNHMLNPLLPFSGLALPFLDAPPPQIPFPKSPTILASTKINYSNLAKDGQVNSHLHGGDNGFLQILAPAQHIPQVTITPRAR